MKYVMAEIELSGMKQKIPFIFPNQLVHEEVYRAMVHVLRRHGFEYVSAVSAGTVSFGLEESLDPVIHCSGESTTLKLKAQDADAQTIERYDYFHGLY